MSEVAPLLPYADLPSQYGIVVERSPISLTIKVPRASLWRRPETLVIGGMAVMFASFPLWAAVLGAMGAGNGTPVTRFHFFIFGLSIAAAAGLALGVIYLVNRFWTTRTEAIFVVKDGLLYVTSWNEEGENTRHWPTAQIGNIKGNLYGMGLTIRVTGTDMIELIRHHPQDVRVWIAEELRAAITTR